MVNGAAKESNCYVLYRDNFQVSTRAKEVIEKLISDELNKEDIEFQANGNKEGIYMLSYNGLLHLKMAYEKIYERTKSKNIKRKYIGVAYYPERRKPYKAQCQIRPNSSGKKTLGWFFTQEEAGAAYDKYKRENWPITKNTRLNML